MIGYTAKELQALDFAQIWPLIEAWQAMRDNVPFARDEGNRTTHRLYNNTVAQLHQERHNRLVLRGSYTCSEYNLQCVYARFMAGEIMTVGNLPKGRVRDYRVYVQGVDPALHVMNVGDTGGQTTRPLQVGGHGIQMRVIHHFVDLPIIKIEEIE